MTRLHIDEVHPKGSTYPLIVNFLNGYPTDDFGSQECVLFDNGKNKLKTVCTQLDDILYAGDEENDQLTKTFILRRNKSTGKVRIFEAGLVNLKPILNIDKDTLPQTEISNLELSRKFGSKKQKQRMEQREKLKVNIDTVVEQMQNATQEISEDTLDLSNYNKSDSDDFYVPPINRSAEKVDEVYDINMILSEEQYSQISSEIQGKDFTQDLSPWIKDIITNKNLSNKHTVLALYADCLMKLYGTVAREIAKKVYTICPHSNTLNEIILSQFTLSSNDRRTRPATYKDKALCHAIAFLILINNFKFDLDKICEITKISPSTATLKTRVTGASVITVGNKKVVQLKLPLTNKVSFRRKSSKF